MRGNVELGAPQRVAAGIGLALFVLFLTLPALAAAPDWKGAVAEIERTQDEAVWAFNELVAGYEQYLLTEPSAQEAGEELAEVKDDIKQVKRNAKSHVRQIMRQHPDSPQVQQAGTAALESITAAKDFAMELVTFRYDEYVAGLPDPPSSTTTTTTLPPTSTTTSSTTTTLPPVTTTSAPPSSSTTTSSTTTPPPVVTTTSTPPVPTTNPPTTATTTTAPTIAPVTTTTPAVTTTAPPTTTTNPPSTTTTSTSPGGGSSSSRLRSGAGLSVYAIEQPPDVAAGSSRDGTEGGLAASFSRVLEPVLPAGVADVVASPLLVLELLWRAIASSGRGLVTPVALLTFSAISLLWDRRRARARPAGIEL